jgi:hypothetical protein
MQVHSEQPAACHHIVTGAWHVQTLLTHTCDDAVQLPDGLLLVLRHTGARVGSHRCC